MGKLILLTSILLVLVVGDNTCELTDAMTILRSFDRSVYQANYKSQTNIFNDAYFGKEGKVTTFYTEPIPNTLTVIWNIFKDSRFCQISLQLPQSTFESTGGFCEWKSQDIEVKLSHTGSQDMNCNSRFNIKIQDEYGTAKITASIITNSSCYDLNFSTEQIVNYTEKTQRQKRQTVLHILLIAFLSAAAVLLLVFLFVGYNLLKKDHVTTLITFRCKNQFTMLVWIPYIPQLMLLNQEIIGDDPLNLYFIIVSATIMIVLTSIIIFISETQEKEQNNSIAYLYFIVVSCLFSGFFEKFSSYNVLPLFALMGLPQILLHANAKRYQMDKLITFIFFVFFAYPIPLSFLKNNVDEATLPQPKVDQVFFQIFWVIMLAMTVSTFSVQYLMYGDKMKRDEHKPFRFQLLTLPEDEVLANLQCPICEERLCVMRQKRQMIKKDFPFGQVTRFPCDHMAHVPCVNKWRLKSKLCPTCSPLKEEVPPQQK